MLFLAGVGLNFNIASAVGYTQSPATDQLHTPAQGSAERKAIVDVLREDYQKRAGEPVIFKVNYLMVNHGWAWADVTPLDDQGRAVAEGWPSLLHKRKGSWKIMDLSVVPTDPDDPLEVEANSPKFFRKVEKAFPGVPWDIFPKSGK